MVWFFKKKKQGDVRFVLDAAKYLKQLRRQALKLLKPLRASRRGYFLPNEEEKVRQLLISYWNVRAALLDLIFSIEPKVRDEKEDYVPVEPFLMGYAAALILIETALFLYHAVDDLPVVRKKLNEEDRSFGIPKDCYNAIQKSLMDPAHLLMIQRAHMTYDHHRREFYAMAGSDRQLKKVIRLIDALKKLAYQDRFTHVKDFVAIHAKQLLEVERSTIENVVYGIQESASRLVSRLSTRPSHKPGLPGEIKKALLKIMKPGDVLITRKEYAMTNYFLPGFWPHASLYLGHVDGEPKVLEALKDGVHVRPVNSPFSSDAIVVIRPELSAAQIQKAIKRGLKHEGKSYDFDFDFTRSDRLVCTEVVYRSYEGIGGLSFALTSRAGRKTLSAEDLLKMAYLHQGFNLLAGFYAPLGSHLNEAEQTNEILAKTMPALTK